jgi:hypothetical protein
MAGPASAVPSHADLVRAIADPGSVLPRGNQRADGSSDYSESIPSWSARAVRALLTATPTSTEEADTDGR